MRIRQLRPVLATLASTVAAAVLLTACGSSGSTAPADSAAPAGATPYASLTASPACTQLRGQHPELAGKKMTNAINPHTPGYESISVSDPNRYEGFDIDLGEAIGACLGFTVSYLPVSFETLLPTLRSGQANFVISDIYATKERAASADFITYSKVFDGVLVAKGNPKKLTGIDDSLCGTTTALNKGFVEVPLVAAQSAKCTAEGKPAAQASLFDNNADCVQAILAGRADSYINDVNTVTRFVKEQPDQLDRATAVTLPYSIGIGVPKDNTAIRAAFTGALTEVQRSGLQTTLSKKWQLDESAIESPSLVTAS
ncbi:MAG TPA: ABC transporter substrate-binding protein [Pseudonocardia sp.]|jgi:polar amino acid transport system substrate-binding protein|nr:ABC transporter substrate-binding protein [Pseudonocardia sp.]